MEDQVFRLHEGWFCIVGGAVHGPWPDKGTATAGLATEQRRAANRAAEKLQRSGELLICTKMKLAGYEDHNTGGGCMAWMKPVGDQGDYLMISNENALFGDPNAKVWMVGRYGPEGGFAEMTGPDECGYTLDEAIAIADQIPSPVVDADRALDDQFETIEEVTAALAALKGASQ